MLGRAPRLALGELKPGERLIVVSTEGAKSSEVTAIVVLAGVEPILATQPKGSSHVVLGPWNMGMREGEGTP
jgi:TusA-related sulfurtransferase